LREHWRTVAIGFVAVLFAFVAFRGGDGDEDPAAPGTDDPDESIAPPAGTGEEGTDPTVPEPSTTLTTLTPPDVERERAPVDLATPPSGTDAVEVARWWAASYAVYGGAETPAALVTRLAPLTSDRYRQTLGLVPPAASYDAPLELEGATGTEIAGGSGTRIIRVVVETSVALLVYDVTLTEDPPGSWLVSESVRV
jgi:hypothetical protein